MKKAIIATTVAIAGVSSPAMAAVDLTGATVTARLLYPDTSTTYAGPIVATVGPGVEFKQGDFTGPQGRAEGSFDITPTSITFFTNQNATYGAGSFNGYQLDFANFTGSLSDLKFSSSSTFTPLSFSVNGNSVFLNVSGQTVQASDSATLAAVPEPATWAMMLVGFGAVGFGMRRRRSQEGRKTSVRFAF